MGERGKRMAPQVNFDVDAEQVRSLKVDGRGRVTIPQELRDDLGIRPYDRASVVVLGPSDEE